MLLMGSTYIRKCPIWCWVFSHPMFFSHTVLSFHQYECLYIHCDDYHSKKKSKKFRTMVQNSLKAMWRHPIIYELGSDGAKKWAQLSSWARDWACGWSERCRESKSVSSASKWASALVLTSWFLIVLSHSAPIWGHELAHDETHYPSGLLMIGSSWRRQLVRW